MTSRGSSLWVKGALVFALGGAAGFVVHALASDAAPPVAPVPAAVAAPARLPLSLTSASAAAAAPAGPILQLPTVSPDSAPRLEMDQQLAEAALLERARSLLSRNPAAAFELTAEHGRSFPDARLGAEAELLAVQALLGLNDVEGAKARARASLSRYPSGSYAQKLRELAEAP